MLKSLNYFDLHYHYETDTRITYVCIGGYCMYYSVPLYYTNA